MMCDWRPAPRELEPPALGSVHVWHADLCAVPAELSDALSAREHARAAGILAPSARERFTRARSVLRALIGSYLDCGAGAVELVDRGPEGGPALRGRELAFSVSHSGDRALYAFVSAGRVGVDIEVRRRALAVGPLAARLLGEAEARRLGALSEPARTDELLAAWVAHEARAKAAGGGLWRDAGRSSRSGWVAHLDVGAGAAAALALPGPPSQPPLCLEWQAPARGPSEARTQGACAQRILMLMV